MAQPACTKDSTIAAGWLDTSQLMAFYPGAIMVVSNDMQPLFLNPQAQQLAAELALTEDVFAANILGKHQLAVESIERDRPLQSKVHLAGANGRGLNLAIRSIYGRIWGADAHCLFFDQLTEKSIYDDRVQCLANYDDLTSLLNRHGLKIVALKAIEQQRDNRWFCFFIKINGMVNRNESCGRRETDLAITTCAALLIEHFSAKDIKAHISEGEFLVLCPRSESSSQQAYLNFVKSVADYNATHPSTISLSVSVGVAAGMCRNPSDLEHLVNSAGTVLYDCHSSEFFEHHPSPNPAGIFSRA